jgi:XapX domain-containing protein
MKLYLVSLGAGVLVGLLYGLLHVRSPAPPVVALIGLAGMLLGEQVVPFAQHLVAGSRVAGAAREPHSGAVVPFPPRSARVLPESHPEQEERS